MTPLNQLDKTLRAVASSKHYLFTLSDLSSVLPNHSRSALQIILSRAVKKGLLERVCRVVYTYIPMRTHMMVYCCITLRPDSAPAISTTSA